MQVTLYDTNNMKKALDEAVVKSFAAASGYSEDMRLSNLKLLIMTVACAFGCVAQFYPLPFPANRWLLAICVVVYYGLSAVLQAMTWWVERDYIYSSAAGSKAKSPRIHLRSQMPRFQEHYTVLIELAGPGTVLVTAAVSVGKLFTSTGHLSLTAVEEWVRTALVTPLQALDAKKKS